MVRHVHSGYDEQTSLLVSQIEQLEDPTNGEHLSNPKYSRRRYYLDLQAIRHWIQRWRVVLLCMLYLSCLTFPAHLGETARLKILEIGVCRDYYSKTDPKVVGPDGRVPEELCKIDPIQESLAGLRAVQSFLNGLQGKSKERWQLHQSLIS
jgi:hypothetical protein